MSSSSTRGPRAARRWCRPSSRHPPGLAASRLSRQFQAAVAALGARHKRIRPHCPWQNGKVERFNRTLATVVVDGKSALVDVIATRPEGPSPAGTATRNHGGERGVLQWRRPWVGRAPARATNYR